jgi:hypothetical protein
MRAAGPRALPMLLQLGVHGCRQVVNDDRASLRAAIHSNRQDDPAPVPRVQVPLKQVWWLHDVHVAVDEPKAVLHDDLSFPVVSLRFTHAAIR